MNPVVRGQHVAHNVRQEGVRGRPAPNQVGPVPVQQQPVRLGQQAWGVGLQDVQAPRAVAQQKKLENTDAMLKRIDVQLNALNAQGLNTSPAQIKANAEGGAKSFFKALGKMVTSIPAKVTTAVITAAKGVFNLGQVARLLTYPIGKCFAGAQGADQAVKAFFSSGNDKMNAANESVRQFFGGGGSKDVNAAARDAANDAFGSSLGMVSDSYGMGFAPDAVSKTQLGKLGDVKNGVLSQAGVHDKPGDVSMNIGMPLAVLQVTDSAETVMGGFEKRADGKARVAEGEQLRTTASQQPHRQERKDLRVAAQFMEQSGEALKEEGTVDIVKGTVGALRGGNGIANLLATSNTYGPQLYGVQATADAVALWTQVGGAAAGTVVATVDTVVDSVQSYRVGKRIDRANRHLDNPASLTQVTADLGRNQTRLDRVREQLGEKNQALTQAQDDVATGKRRLNRVEQQMDNTQQTLDQVKGDLRSARQDRNGIVGQLNEAKQALSTRQARLQQAEDKLARNTLDQTECQAALKPVVAKVRGLRAEISALKAPPKGQAVDQKLLTQKEGAYAEAKLQRQNLETELKQLGQEGTRLQAEQASYARRTDRQAGRVDTLEGQRQEAQGRVDQLKTRSAELTAGLEGLATRRDDLRTNLGVLRQTRGNLAQEVDQLQTSQTRLEQRVEALSGQQANLKEVEGAVELYKKNLTQTRKHKIMSAVKNAALAAAGVTMIVAATAALAATPVGWALAGAAVVGAVGFGLYKAYKAQRREVNIEGLGQRETLVNNALQQFQQTHQMQNANDTARLSPAQKGTLKDLLAVRSEIQGALARTSPQRAVNALVQGLSNPDPLISGRAQEALRNVFKLDPRVFSATVQQTSPNAVQVARDTLASKLSLFQASA